MYEGLKKSYGLDKTYFYTYGKVYSLKRSRKNKDEDPSDGSDRGHTRLNQKSSRKYVSQRITAFEVREQICHEAQEENPGDQKRDYPFDLTKLLPLVMGGSRQKVPVDYFFNNDLKYLQGGVSTMTYTTSITKTKAAQYDLPGIEDMVPNIWVPVKVAYGNFSLERTM
ncbi:hypothetical protein Tco_0578641 [Tanacetum coccineum]